MKKQKGQVIIEFALILPLFIILLFGIIYCGMLFYDYISLSNIARSAARESAIVSSFDSTQRAKIENYYTQKITGGLLTSLYEAEDVPDTGDPSKSYKITVSEDDNGTTGDTSDDGVKVVIIMNLNVDTSPLMRMILPPNFKIEYFMRRDEQANPSGTNS